MSVKISVIIPTYNRSYILQRPLQSLLNQSFNHWEAIIVDDGSFDDTEACVERFGDKRFIYTSKSNEGAALAREYGRKKARGEIIVYLDSDDVLLSNALEDIYHQITKYNKNYGITAHNRTLLLIDKNGQVLDKVLDSSGLSPQLTPADIYTWKFKTTGSGLFHRNDPLYSSVVWRPQIMIEDWEFLLSLICADPDGFIYVPKVCVDYVATYGGDGLCSGASYADYGHAFKMIYELHKNDPLLIDHDVFLTRIKNYPYLHQQAIEGKIAPPQYKYFPNWWKKT